MKTPSCALPNALGDRFHDTNRFWYFTSGSYPGSRALARVAKPYPEGSSTVIARSACDEAIHYAAYAALDCFAHRTAPCAEPVARNNG